MNNGDLELEKSNSKKSPSDIVLDLITEKLKNGDWTPNMKIWTEPEIMKAAGVGRSAVREAIEKLVTLGVLVKKQGNGTFVKEPSNTAYFNTLFTDCVFNEFDPISVLEFRIAIEPSCVALCIERYDEQTVAELEEYMNIMKQSYLTDARQAFFVADCNFHFTIAKGSKNPLFVKVIEILNQTMSDYHALANRTIGPKTGVAEHEAILDAIKEKDSELAAFLLKRHLERSRNDLEEFKKHHKKL